MNETRRVKVVFVDGNLSNGVPKVIRGLILEENPQEILVETSEGKHFKIGKNFIVKIDLDEVMM